MARIKKENIEKQESSCSPQEQLASFLNKNQEDHLNFLEAFEDYKISSSSLLMDMATNGGLGAGLHRLCGIAEGGKSSLALEYIRNFLAFFGNRARAIYIKAEGRLSTEMQKRCGLKFVWKANEWADNTVFVFECNVFEVILNMMSDLTKNNPNDYKYIFFIDSLDGVILKKDSEKELEGDSKVAGVPKLFKQFAQKIANAFSKRGHMLLIASQRSATIRIDPYAPVERKQVEASGGSAIEHFTNFVFEMQAKNSDDYILEDPNSKFDPIKNKYIGHVVRVKVKKSVNEKTGTIIKYPVKYGVIGRTSVWQEREIADLVLAFEYGRRNGAWINFTPEFCNEMKEKSFDFPEKIQGLENLYMHFESNPDQVKYLFNKFKNILTEN